MNVRRAALLDVRAVAPYYPQLLVFVGIMTLFAATKTASTVMPVAAFFAVFTAAYPFAVAEKYDLDTLEATLPLRRRDVLAGRYAGAVVIFVVAVTLATVVTVVNGVLRGGEGLDAASTVSAIGVSWAAFAVIEAAQLPIYVRWGYNQARLVAFVPVLLLVMVITVVVPRLPHDASPSPWWLAVLAGAGALVLVASYALSVRIDPRRVD